MKTVWGLLFLTIFIGNSNAIEDWSQYTRDQIIELQQIKELKENKTNIQLLTNAKKYIVNGEIKKAEKLLDKMDYTDGILALIRDRYLALVYFLQEDFKRSYDILSKDKFNIPAAYRETCQLKLMNEIILFPKKRLREKFLKCSVATLEYSKNELAWLTAMVQLHEKNFDTINNNFPHTYSENENDLISSWMKIAIFANQENIVINKIKSFPASAFYSKRIRELAGLAYYRAGNYENAMDFVEDISTANSEIIKGNIALLKQEYEIAYGHFKVALLKKENSINALERVIPLSWTLEQWQEGIQMLNRRIIDKENERKIITLNTAFKLRLDQFENAYKQLQILDVLFSKKLPKEILIMHSFVAAMLDHDEDLKLYTSNACKKNDGLNCWLMCQINLWENFAKTTARTSNTLENKKFAIDDLRKKQSIEPLKEKEFINQSDIEELDNTLVTTQN